MGQMIKVKIEEKDGLIYCESMYRSLKPYDGPDNGMRPYSTDIYIVSVYNGKGKLVDISEQRPISPNYRTCQRLSKQTKEEAEIVHTQEKRIREWIKTGGVVDIISHDESTSEYFDIRLVKGKPIRTNRFIWFSEDGHSEGREMSMKYVEATPEKKTILKQFFEAKRKVNELYHLLFAKEG